MTTTAEHPLYTQEHADKCPSARYVGGVSRYLCECLQPEFCPGAQAQLASTLFSRAELLKGHCTHDQYYAQFLTEGYVNKVAARIGAKRITDSACAHFNDIPLHNWDGCLMSAEAARLMRLTGNAPTLSDGVCLAKAAAKQIRRENADPRKWSITVRYRRVGESCGSRRFETLATGTVDGILDYYMADPINVGDGGADEMAKVIGIDFTPA